MFIATLLALLASCLHIETLNSFVLLLPRSIAAAKKFIGYVSDTFSKYASCPECHSIYPLDTCRIIESNKTVSRKCSYIRFPNHRQAALRQRCDTQLMKNVRTSFGTLSFYPRRLYCYQSLIASLKELIRRPGFIEKCELWRTRNRYQKNCLTDIYDGQVWKSFLNPDGVPFFSAPFNFGLSLNVDWFQPFKYSTYSAVHCHSKLASGRALHCRKYPIGWSYSWTT